MAPTFKRRKAPSTNVEEIRFDPEARQEYLSGFHKRKLQRIKHAQALAAKKQRAEKIEQRRKASLALILGSIERSLNCFPTWLEEGRAQRRGSKARSQCEQLDTRSPSW